VKLTCTSWSFPACSLEEAAGIVQALGIGALDLGLLYKSALDRHMLLHAPETLADHIRALGIEASSLYYLFGETPAERNIADPSSLAANIEDFQKVVNFCREVDVPSVMVLPGIINPGQSRDDALDQSARSLQELLPIAREAGLTLTIEPHVHSYLESPSLVLALLKRVSGLRLTLDYAHFICMGYRQEEIDPLAEHAAHVHLRQASPGVLQSKLLHGTINFLALIASMRKHAYDGYLALEYVHQEYMNTLYEDVLTETVQLRDLIRSSL
jgi:sugar phosphate isomerase/epimerase